MSHWNLFIDDYSIARATGFSRVVHHPKAMGVVIPADKPWETAGVQPMLVEQQQDGTFVCFYNAMWWDIDRAGELDPGFREDRAHHIFHHVGYATSRDGVHWEKPELGVVEAPAGIDAERHAPFASPVGKSKHNNLGVPFVPVMNLGAYGNVVDPGKRYALRLMGDATTGVGAGWKASPHGYFAACLPDFINDPHWQDKLTDSGSSFNPRRFGLHFRDDIHDEWVTMDQGVVGHWLPSRDIARFGSKDLINWTSTTAMYPDPFDSHRQDAYDEPMSLTPFYTEGVAFGLLSWFHSDRTHPDGGPVLDKSPEHPVRWPWCRKGTNEMRITLSRDGGYTWDRTSSREAWIPHGTEEDSYDRLVIGVVPPVRVGEEDWFYATVINADHLGIRNNTGQTPYDRGRLGRQQTALYIQKRNRYVSLRTGTTKEILITKPVEVSGGRLELNVDAGRGEIRAGVALADPVMTFNGSTASTAPHLYENHMLPGFGFNDAPALVNNSIEQEVAFTGGLNSLRGKMVRLLIEVYNADIYGFRFTDTH